MSRSLPLTYDPSLEAWPQLATPPEGAMNVVFVVLDDVGYAQLGCFGSDIDTPAIDSLAARGYKFTNFHTTALCSPTRAALLTGRNSHRNHVGAVPELATGFPGYDLYMPRENGTIAEVLRDEGWATFCVGKWHLTPAGETSLAAPRDRWPLGKGFERFYGFLGAETSQYSPDLLVDNHQVPPESTRRADYHLSEDLVDQAIEYVGDLRNAAPDKPFFLHLAFGACHAPHQAPPSFIEKYRGRFDCGWDDWRRAVYERQIAAGTLPAGTSLSERPNWIPAWDSLDVHERAVFARMMEVYAGFLEHTDHQVGRLLEMLEQSGDADRTIVVVLSDNGASPEGGRNGASNQLSYLNGARESVPDLIAAMEDLGSSNSYGHYPFGWAWAGNTPLKRWKQEAHEGGIATPMVMSVPGAGGSQSRRQYVHAIDIFPTLLELMGVSNPSEVRGIRQAPLDGASFDHCLKDADAAAGRSTQYYEVRGCRAIYHDGWKAVAYHPRVGLAWDGSDPLRDYADDTWELYHVASDFSECHDRAADEPERLQTLINLWWQEADRNDVLPLDNRGVERLAGGKPQISPERTRYVFRPSPTGIHEEATVILRNVSYLATADLSFRPGDRGVLMSQGSRFAGYTWFLDGDDVVFIYNYLRDQVVEIRGPHGMTAGRHCLEFEFVKTGEHCGIAELRVDGSTVGRGEIEKTIPYTFGLGGDSLYIGRDDGDAVTPIYQPPFAYTGPLYQVDVALTDGGPHVHSDRSRWIRELQQ